MLNWLARRLRISSPATPPREELDGLLREAAACRRDGRHDAAERYLYRALALAPESAEIHLQLGDLFRALGRHDAALDRCLEAVRLAPGMAQARNNLGNAYRDVGRTGDAIAEFRRAVSLDASLPEAQFNLGVALQQRGEGAEAAECYRRVLQSRPAFPAAHLNLGLLLEERGDSAGAIAAYGAAVAAEPDMVEAHVNLGMQLLLSGRFSEGWPEYEWRLRYPEYRGSELAARASRWDGADLGGRTILLEAEQGFGDAIQFLRYAPLVAERGGRVLVRCAPQLAGLVAAAPGVAGAIARGAALPAYDTWCPLPSLPQVFGTRLESIPARVPYLHADAGKAVRWRARLADAAVACRVGLVWASQSEHRTAPAKSMPLAKFAALGGVEGVRFYSLQKGEAAGEALQAPRELRIEDLSADLADFSETAAVVANLDLVISVDTAVAHLAGALGKPVWTLLKFAPDWRWLLVREDCPWYPTMRLFRQVRPGDWGAPVEALAKALAAFASVPRQRQELGR